jgi:hypothetical protein
LVASEVDAHQPALLAASDDLSLLSGQGLSPRTIS